MTCRLCMKYINNGRWGQAHLYRWADKWFYRQNRNKWSKMKLNRINRPIKFNMKYFIKWYPGKHKFKIKFLAPTK